MLSGAAVLRVELWRSKARAAMRMSRDKPGDVAEEGSVASVVHNGGTAALREKRTEKGEIFCFEGAAGA